MRSRSLATSSPKQKGDHSLKSSSLNVGALDLGALCRALEESARTGKVPDATQQVTAIATGFDEVRSALLAERAERAAS